VDKTITTKSIVLVLLTTYSILKVTFLTHQASKMFSQCPELRQLTNIAEEIRGLQERRKQTGTSKDEKAAIDQRLQELEIKKIENVRKMNTMASAEIVS